MKVSQAAIVKLIKAQPGLPTAAIAKALGVSLPHCRLRLNRLRVADAIERAPLRRRVVGRPPFGWWPTQQLRLPFVPSAEQQAA